MEFIYFENVVLILVMLQAGLVTTQVLLVT